MSEAKLESLSTERLLERYVELSLEQFGSTEIDDHDSYNKIYDEIDAINRVLRERGPDARRALLPLLRHDNSQVRLNAAHDLLGIEPRRARAALEWVAKWGPRPQSGSAGMSLQRLDDGQYKPT